MSQTELSYHGNPNLKPIGYEHDFTKEQLEEFVKCEQDPIYFIENYCQIVTLDKGLLFLWKVDNKVKLLQQLLV